MIDHRRFQMTEGSSCNLLYLSLAARQPNCVVLRGEVSHQSSHAIMWMQEGERLFEKGRLARARARDQAHNKCSLLAETLAQRPSNDVILLQNVFTHFQQARCGAHRVPPEQ